jgi:hypothetical protein
MSTYYRTLLNQNNVVPPPPSSYLLDDYPGALQAFSIYKLSSSALYSARVRRNSDQQELDIGFVNDIIDLNAISQFIQGTQGFFTIIYDQTSNNRNWIQNASSNQSRHLGDSEFRLALESQYAFYNTPSLAFLTEAEVFTVVKANSDPASNTFSMWNKQSSASSSHYPWQDGVIYEAFGSTTRKTVGNPTTPLNQYNLYNISTAANYWEARLNKNSLFSTNTNTVGFNNNPTLGSGTSDHFFKELILYPSLKTASDRDNISNNIISRFSL